MDYSQSTDPSYPGGCKNGQGPTVSGGAGGVTVNVPNNGRLIRNLGMAANTVMSHILHFYHLVALDYVDVNSTGLIPKGFFCPNYDSNYYARGIDPILQTGGLGAPAYTVNNAPLPNPGIPAGVLGDLTPYFAGQYVRALKFRRLCHQIGALFTGKMPQASSYTPGCVTTKAYDPAPGGDDAAVVQKMHEIMYGGPGFTPTVADGSTSGATNPLGGTISVTNPHPESILGFIGKPSDFWAWAAGGFAPGDLPIWAVAGVPGAGATWKKFTGTFLFDTVAAAHVFPEYFWFGSGYGRTLAWGIFEGAAKAGVSPETQDCALNYGDQRLITRGRTIIPRVPNGVMTPYSFQHLPANHLDAREFTTNSAYVDSPAKLASGRHMWSGKTKAEPMNQGLAFPPGTASNASAYSYAKSPRYLWTAAEGGPNAYVPFEVGPYARMMSNAGVINGGPATAGQVLLVDAGQVGCYYPGILKDVDVTLEGVLGIPSILPGNGIGVFPGWGANLTAHLTFLQTAVPGSPVFYLPPGAMSPLALTNGYAWDYYGDATLDRIACRTLETYYIARQMVNWFASLTKNVNSNQTLLYDWGNGNNKKMPKYGAKGAGLTEAPRGALGHWIKIGKPKSSAKFKKFKGKVSNYQIITPTTWNINPKAGPAGYVLRGPAEECMMDTPLVNPAEPIECLRVYHSFDFCCACTVHVLKKKKEVAKVTMEALP